MKKIVILAMSVFILNILGTAKLHSERDDEIRTIKKAVKENSSVRSGKEIKWLKVLVTDTRAKTEKVKISIPLSLAELLMGCAHGRHLRIDCEEYDIDLKELLSELKHLEPGFLIEISDDEASIKIWLE
jgi:hypothetical protein